MATIDVISINVRNIVQCIYRNVLHWYRKDIEDIAFYILTAVKKKNVYILLFLYTYLVDT